MKTITSIAVLLLLTKTALAATADTVLPQTVPMWTAVVITLLAAASGALRMFTSDTNFVHTKGGAFVIAAACAALTAVSEAIRANGLHASVIMFALASAVASTLTMMNPTLISQSKATATDVKEQGFVRIEIAFGIFAVGLFVLLMCTMGCAAWKTCELGKLPASSETVLTDVTDIVVSGGANWESDLEQLALTLAPGQADCAIKAIASAWSARGASMSIDRVAALSRLQLYLQHHPKAADAKCGQPGVRL